MELGTIIANQLNNKDLDIRKTRYSRFMDQKVTPDVLSFIADCIINYIYSNPETPFTRKDITNSEYFSKNVTYIYHKPMPNNSKTAREYDKFVGQPLRMMTYAGILEATTINRGYSYKVSNLDLLDQISRNQYNAFECMYVYLEKVLKDSGFYKHVEEYITKCKEGTCTNSDLQMLKQSFVLFIRGNTNINRTLEVNRIFPKVINIFAVKNSIPGIQSGRITKQSFYMQDLMYNAVNFRDKWKDKAISRQEAIRNVEEDNHKYQISKAKALIKRIHTSSELNDRWNNGVATQVHHIFPEKMYPAYSAYTENLILLTPDQHNVKAHPNNNTAQIDPIYQKSCVLAKINSIRRSIEAGETYYSIDRLRELLVDTLSLNLNGNMELSDIEEAVREFNPA